MKRKTLHKVHLTYHVAAAVGCAALLPVLLVRPVRPTARKKAPFRNRAFAHRGLHSADGAVPENTLAAFRAAAEAGYGIELDVRLSRDGQVVVFHDDTLERLCGDARRVDAVDWAELRTLRPGGTEETIPLFSEVLEAIDGRVPLIVELKSGPRDRELCEKVCALLGAYRGDVCVESFHPLIVAWFRFHAPQYLRGQLAMQPEAFAKIGCSRVKSALLGNTLLNAVAGPEFIAYRLGPRPPLVKLAERFGALRVGWTARDPAEGEGQDAVIFEHCRPPVRYK